MEQVGYDSSNAESQGTSIGLPDGGLVAVGELRRGPARRDAADCLREHGRDHDPLVAGRAA